METKPGFVGFRRAFIHTINNDNTYDIFYSDDNSNNVIKGVNAISLGSFGSGVFSRYHEGAPVWISQSYYYQPLIVGFADIPGSIEQGNILESNDIDAPRGDPGEIFIQASSGAHIDLRKTGDIKLSNLKNDGLFLSDPHRAIITTSYQRYDINDGGYTIEGRVKRFGSNYIPGQDPVLVDLLSDPEADAFTTEIARDQNQKPLAMNRARGVANVIRNPAFAEKREMILEFADSFFVRDANTEITLATEFPKTLQEMDRSIAKRRGYGINEQTFDNLRHSSRTNVLKLDTNVIVERVQGTLVDVFGNVLDLNYNKINFPKLTEKGKDAIQEAHILLNRSVAYHFQVNSRNIITNTSTGSGKFTFDVDKEGQFKLNVPRSSTLGTTPTISSFVNNSTNITSRIDINNTSLSKSDISAPTGGLAGTAFHDMTLAADRLIRHSIKALNPIRVHDNAIIPNIEFVVSPDNQFPDTIPQNTTTLSVMPDQKAISTIIDASSAGGRSGLINFEGSIEVSVGKDEVDKKSIMLDTDGSFISWFGMDAQGRSIITNTDGDVLLNIGGYVNTNNGNQVFNSQSSLTIRVNLIDEKAIGELQPEQLGDNKTSSDHIIHISSKGIIISSGNGTPMVLRSSGDFNIEAAGAIDIKGREIRIDAGGGVRRVSPKKGDI